MRYFALALVALSVISCNRDPNYLKQKYSTISTRDTSPGAASGAGTLLLFRRSS